MNQTRSSYEALLAGCNFRSPEAVSQLVTASHTNTVINDFVNEKHLEPDSAYSYFSGFFGTEVWEDGQGMDEVREYSTQNYIPISYEYFTKKMTPCNGEANAGECDWQNCEIPEGGRGTMPGFQMYEWGLETPRDCIANIRHINQFMYWAKKIIESRQRADEAIMGMFYTMTAWKTSGHKVVLEHSKDVNGNYSPLVSNDIRNPFRGFSYNYMEEFFPQVLDPNNIGPLSLSTLETLAKTWTDNNSKTNVAVGSRGEKIWELWAPDDWYRDEGLRNREYLEAIKKDMPMAQFAGYTNQTGQREVIGNFAIKNMTYLPRLQVSSEGGLIPVDTHEGVDVQTGQEFLLSPSWQNAPFAMAIAPSPKQGKIITRPTLSQSGAGFAIEPIMSIGDWRIRNDFDKECNKNLNQPYSEKHYEMGMRMDDPDAALSVIYRRRMFRSEAENFCDLQPVVVGDPNEVCKTDFLGIGCRGGKVKNQASLTQVDFTKMVNCTTEMCGNGESAPYFYHVHIDRMAEGRELGCGCGSEITVFIGDETGEVTHSLTGKVADISRAFPDGIYTITIAEKLEAGECIKGVACQDATPDSAVYVSYGVKEDDGGDFIVTLNLDSPLNIPVDGEISIDNGTTSEDFYAIPVGGNSVRIVDANGDALSSGDKDAFESHIAIGVDAAAEITVTVAD